MTPGKNFSGSGSINPLKIFPRTNTLKHCMIKYGVLNSVLSQEMSLCPRKTAEKMTLSEEIRSREHLFRDFMQ